MSLMTQSFDLCCDECSVWLHVKADTLTSARRRLRVLGWATRIQTGAAAHDYCPKCRAERDAKVRLRHAARQRARVAKQQGAA